jgi:hypothetical protein
MSKLSLLSVAVLASGLAVLSSGQTAEAAIGVPLGVNKALDKNGVQQIHYSRRYGWHCGMWERYGHGHREACWRMRHGGWGWGHGRRDWDRDGKRGSDRDRDGDRDGRDRNRNGDR